MDVTPAPLLGLGRRRVPLWGCSAVAARSHPDAAMEDAERAEKDGLGSQGQRPTAWEAGMV